MPNNPSQAYETIKGLYKIGLVDETDFEKVKLLNSTKRDLPYPLEPVFEYTPLEIKQLRLREKLTQTEFALYLNADLKTIRDWEKGVKKPSDIEYKLLNVILNKGLKAITYQTGKRRKRQSK
jgi:putative transcriptional regulator